MKISVVVPAFNEEKRIGSLLESLYRQESKPFEVIVVNNGSTDKTVEKIRAYEKKFEEKKIRLRVVDEPVVGVSRARNRGFRAAVGEIVASTDSDNRVPQNWISSIQEHFAQHDSVAVTGHIIFEDAPLIVRKLTEWGYFRWYFDFTRTVFGFPFISTANCAITKQGFKAVGGFNEEIVDINDLDDFELASRIIEIGRVRFEETMAIKSSFRRYQKWERALATYWKRNQSMFRIVRAYKQRSKKNDY